MDATHTSLPKNHYTETEAILENCGTEIIFHNKFVFEGTLHTPTSFVFGQILQQLPPSRSSYSFPSVHDLHKLSEAYLLRRPLAQVDLDVLGMFFQRPHPLRPTARVQDRLEALARVDIVGTYRR